MYEKTSEYVLDNESSMLYEKFTLTDIESNEIKGTGFQVVSEDELLKIYQTNPELAKQDVRLEDLLNSESEPEPEPTAEEMLNAMLGVTSYE